MARLNPYEPHPEVYPLLPKSQHPCSYCGGTWWGFVNADPFYFVCRCGRRYHDCVVLTDPEQD